MCCTPCAAVLFLLPLSVCCPSSWQRRFASSRCPCDSVVPARPAAAYNASSTASSIHRVLSPCGACAQCSFTALACAARSSTPKSHAQVFPCLAVQQNRGAWHSPLPNICLQQNQNEHNIQGCATRLQRAERCKATIQWNHEGRQLAVPDTCWQPALAANYAESWASLSTQLLQERRPLYV